MGFFIFLYAVIIQLVKTHYQIISLRKKTLRFLFISIRENGILKVKIHHTEEEPVLPTMVEFH